MYLIVVDTTHSVTFTSPVHRSIYKRSSDWSVDNRSIGHQNVSFKNGVALDPFTSDKKQTETDMKGLILIRLTLGLKTKKYYRHCSEKAEKSARYNPDK